MVTGLTGSGPPSDQIYRHLSGQILAGRLLPDERLPTVRQLARDLAVAPGTVARAYKMLESDGLVRTRAGGGTRVSHTAGAFPPEVMQAARELHSVAVRHGLDFAGTVASLQTFWEDIQQQNGTEEPVPPADGS